MSAALREIRAVPAHADQESDLSPGLRREVRLDVVRRVDYAPYPRARTSQCERVGFTRDFSASGMCLRLDAPEPVGSLLRLTQSEIDGRTTQESIARVVWSAPTVDGGWWVGLSLLAPRRPLRVAPRSHAA